MKFSSSNGCGNPTAQARRYAYGVLVSMLDSQMHHHPENVEGWMFGGIEDEADQRRLMRVLKQLQTKFAKLAGHDTSATREKEQSK